MSISASENKCDLHFQEFHALYLLFKRFSWRYGKTNESKYQIGNRATMAHTDFAVQKKHYAHFHYSILFSSLYFVADDAFLKWCTTFFQFLLIVYARIYICVAIGREEEKQNLLNLMCGTGPAVLLAFVALDFL